MSNSSTLGAKPYLTAPQPSSKMPGGIPYIIFNEAAERYSFYGMKCILTIFMTQYLHLMGDTPGQEMSEAAALANFHTFNSLVYFLPVAGALLADALLGKYRTIMSLSIVYCLGHAALALMGAVGDPQMWLVTGLLLISIGSGGIKPCVTAHVGDQFGKSNKHLLEKVFNFFYFSINLGAFLSTMATPYILEYYGPHWAFGIPGVLMGIATLMFWMGRHKFVHIPPGGMKFIRESFSKEGLLAIAKLSIVYVFVAVFWALFDQTGSSWVIQVENMDRNWLGHEWLPSQVQAFNPIMVLTFIPIFTFVVYPAINRIWTLTPLRKISLGLFIMIGSFALIATIQEWIDAGEHPSVSWQVLAYVIITAAEVMVSITCLEFSYTQAPKKMKSIILAIFLVSVSLGNSFTAIVNYFIQIEDGAASITAAAKIANKYRTDNSSALPTESAWLELTASLSEKVRIQMMGTEDAEFELRTAGQDGEWNNGDDIVALFDKDGGRTELTTQGHAEVELAVQKVEAYYLSNQKLPGDEAGKALVASSLDPWGQPLIYTLINSKKFRILSSGADKTVMTSQDVGVSCGLPKAKEEKKNTWLERRKAELGLDKSPTENDEFKVSRHAFIGGQVTLEGASYFWFFTKLMAATALLFVVVAFLYKPKEYIQEEAVNE